MFGAVEFDRRNKGVETGSHHLSPLSDHGCGGRSSSYRMASTGQTDTHSAQLTHSSGWMQYFRPPSQMLSTGYTSVQIPSFPLHVDAGLGDDAGHGNASMQCPAACQRPVHTGARFSL